MQKLVHLVVNRHVQGLLRSPDSSLVFRFYRHRRQTLGRHGHHQIRHSGFGRMVDRDFALLILRHTRTLALTRRLAARPPAWPRQRPSAFCVRTLCLLSDGIVTINGEGKRRGRFSGGKTSSLEHVASLTNYILLQLMLRVGLTEDSGHNTLPAIVIRCSSST
jgi:hypothetical protein